MDNVNDSKFLRKYNYFFDIDENTKYLYDPTEIDVYKDARNGDKDAFKYLAYLGTRTALTNFWAFLGPNPKSRKIRILNGDFDDYLGYCQEAIYRALNRFNEYLGKDRKISATGFTYYFKRYLAKICLSHNRSMNRNRALNSQTLESDGKMEDAFENILNKVSDDRVNEYDFTKDSSVKSFKMLCDVLKKWDFVKDKTRKFGVSPLELLYYYLHDALTLNQIANKVGMNFAVVKAFINKIVDEVNDHEDDYSYPVESFEDVLQIAENAPEALRYLL